MRTGRPPKHSASKSPTWSSWRAMRKRCLQVTHIAYEKYKDFWVHPQWDDYETFLADMGERPINTSLDRIDNTKGYYPKNCRWASRETQQRNSSLTNMTSEGVKVIRYMKSKNLATTTQLAKAYGISSQSVCDIVAKRSWKEI